MKAKRRALTVKWIVYILYFLLLFTLQQTPGALPVVMGVRPSLLLPAVVCVALYDQELFGAVFGVIAGVLWDLNSINRPFGYSALLLMAIGCLCGLLVTFFMRNNFFTALLLTIPAIAVYEGLTWFIFTFLMGEPNSVGILLDYTLPRAVYSLAVMPILYAIQFLLHRCFRKRLISAEEV